MGFLTAAFEKRTPGPLDDYWYMPFSTKSAAGVVVTESSAEHVAAVFNAEYLISSSMGQMPCVLYRRVNSGKERATEHELYDLLHDQANPELDSVQWVEMMMRNILRWGNFYAEKQRNKGGRIVALWPIPPWRVTPTRAAGPLKYEINIPCQPVVTLGRESVFHVPGVCYDGLRGKSVVSLARETIGLALAAEEFGSRFFSQGANVRGIAEYPAEMSEEGYKRAQESINELVGGLSNAHRIILLEDGMKFTSTTMPLDDAQFLETRKFQITEIARWYNLPPHKIKDLEHATFTNIEHQSLEYVTDCLGPWLNRIQKAYSVQLLSPVERKIFFAEFLVEALLRGDTAARATFYRELFSLGAISPNTICQKENLPMPESGGDQRFVPMNLVPLDMASDVITAPDAPQPPEQKGLSIEKRRAIAVRNARGRNKLAATFRPLFREATAKIVRREVKALKKELEKQQRAAGDFESWVKKYYDDQAPAIRRDLAGVFFTYARAIWDQAQAEIGGDGEWGQQAERLMTGYLDNVVAEWVSSRTGQIGQIVRESDPELVFDDLGQRLDEWDDRTPDKVANRHVIETAGAIAKMVFLAGGFRLMWVNQGSKSCPYCEEMDGRIVGREDAFVAHGEDFQPDGAEPMRINGAKTHPPLHEGCICTIVPV